MRLRQNSAEKGRVGRISARFMLVMYAAVNGFVRVVRFLLWPGARPTEADNVCIYRVGNVGDTICALPAFSAIRQAYPRAKLVLLTSPGRRGAPTAGSVLSGVECFDEILEYFPAEIFRPRAAIALITRLRACRFEVFIELSNDGSSLPTLLRNMIFARLAGAKWGGGWSLNLIPWAAQLQSECIEFPNQVERLLADVERYGFHVGRADFALPVEPGQKNRASVILESLGVPAGARLVGLAPGAKLSVNRWPVERFAEVGKEMSRQGYHVLILGSEEERESAEMVREKIGRACANLAGMTDISGSAAIIQRCSLIICNDSGLQHVASAVGTPCVAIFTAREMWGKWRPHHPHSRMLRKWVPCHTCYLKECPNNNLCLTEISTAEVAGAALEVLSGRRQPDNKAPESLRV